MASAPRAKRQRGTDAASSLAADDVRPSESVWESLEAGRDPHRNGKTLARVDPACLDGVSCAADGEQRAYVLTETEHLSLFFPAAVTRDKNKPLMPDWSFIKLLPPDWYAIVFAVQGQPGSFRAVSASKLCVDGYPAAGKAGDPERAAGFTGGDALRLVAFPNACRFFWAGLHEPLRVKGAWPTAPQVMARGFVLAPEVRAALSLKLDSLTPEGAEPAWLAWFRSTIRERYWGPPPGNPIEQLEQISHLLSSAVELDSTSALSLVMAGTSVMDAAAAAMPLVASSFSVREGTALPEWVAPNLKAAGRMLVAGGMIASALPLDVRPAGVDQTEQLWEEAKKGMEVFLDNDDEFSYDISSAVYRGPAMHTRAEAKHIGYTRMLVKCFDGGDELEQDRVIQFNQPRFPTDLVIHQRVYIDTGLGMHCTEADCAAAIERHSPGRTENIPRVPCALSHQGGIQTLTSINAGDIPDIYQIKRPLLQSVLGGCGFHRGIGNHHSRWVLYSDLKWVSDGTEWKPVGGTWPEEAGRLTKADVRARLVTALEQWRAEIAQTCGGIVSCAQCRHAGYSYSPCPEFGTRCRGCWHCCPKFYKRPTK
jgi:hypothetical protein